jgi:ribonuclease PH
MRRHEEGTYFWSSVGTKVITTSSLLRKRKRRENNSKGNSMCKGQGGVLPISGGSERGQEKEAAGSVVREGRGGGTGRDGAQAGMGHRQG